MHEHKEDNSISNTKKTTASHSILRSQHKDYFTSLLILQQPLDGGKSVFSFPFLLR